MDPVLEHQLRLNRRQFFGLASAGIGTAALATLMSEDLRAAGTPGAVQGLPHFAPTAKRVIYLFQSGGPAQMDLFDYKPRLHDLRGSELPASIRMGQRLTGMTSTQASFPVAPPNFKFAQHGQSGAWVSDLLPHTAKVADDLCFVKSMYTEAINHDPGITFFQTGAQLAGRPSIGAWISYGLGSENSDLPSFVVMVSQGTGRPGDQPLYDRLWGSGFLPSKYQGVLDAGADKVAVNSAALRDPSLIERLAERLGSQSVVVAIDVARAADGWHVRAVAATEETGRDAVVWATEAVERGAGELLVTSIDRDGTRSGYDLELTDAVAGSLRVPVIASGGAGSVDDVAEVLEAGASAALLASTLHFEILRIGPLKEALAARGLSMRLPAATPSAQEVAAWLG